MSRSRRKTPVGGMSTAVSEKDFKQQCNQTFRAQERRLLRLLMDDPEADMDVHLPRRLRDVVETWAGPKDGKSYFGDMKHKDPKYFNKLMRK